jgi:hypothetical protein
MPPNDMAPLLEYSEELFAPETETHRWIRVQMEERGFPPIQISPLEGRILAVLARLAGGHSRWVLRTVACLPPASGGSADHRRRRAPPRGFGS